MSVTKATKCRVCGSTHLLSAVDIGHQYLQGSFVFAGKENPTVEKFPTEVVICDKSQGGCGLVQMAHSVDPGILYEAYWYRSGINRTMTQHLAGIVREVTTILNRDNLRVLDIGCNDGTLLKSYPSGTTRFGVDPSDVAKTIPIDVATVFSDFFPSPLMKDAAGSEKLDAVTSIAMFYDLESPVDFASSVRELLSDVGVWVFEMSYLPLMLIQNSFDTICHEHLEYYSLAVLDEIASKAGFKIFRAELNEINGGSIRCYATPAANNRFNNVADQYFLESLRAREREINLTDLETYKNFQTKIEEQKDAMIELLDRIRNAGKTVHVYGASTKGNTILQWYGIDKNVIPIAAERNPDKYGARTVGSDISIVSEAESRAMKPDYYLVLPWHFKAEFMEREHEILSAGTRFIFPLPTLDVVGVDGPLSKDEWV